MTLMEFSIFPVGRGESLSPYVARVLAVVDESGLAYRLTPMGTIVEGEFAALTALLERCFRALAADCSRVSLQAKFDHRAGQESRLESKPASVEQKLGRPLKR